MNIINKLKCDIVKAAHAAQKGHIPSAFSILDIVWALYNDILLKDDVFVLSKGHGCLALYAVLAEKGLITYDQLMSFAHHGSILGGHPDRNKVPGVVASTGSLGHGLPMACGVALAKKIKKEFGRVYVLVGDGELNEGSCWESLLIADQHGLDNLTIIVDYNKSNKASIDLSDLGDKFRSFGIQTHSCLDGHDADQLITCLKYTLGGPHAVIAHTMKGNGCERMQLDNSWHHRAPNDQELVEILEEIN